MSVDVDKKVSFNHSILRCGRTLTNPSSKTAIKPLIVLVKRHKTVLEFGSFLKDEGLLLSSPRPDLWVSTDKVWFISPKYFCVNRFQFNFWKNSKLNSSWTLKFLELHTLFILSLWKKLTPMAVMYQVRCPSVSGTGADWRNLELSPLPLSNDQYILNKRRYHQPRELRHWTDECRIKLCIYLINMV